MSPMRWRRALCGFSQAELAEILVVSRRTIGSIERGSTLPNVTLAIAIAHALDSTVEELFWPDGLR
jgi:putative transcriptional regulator